jgi:HPt (histidine-containing phosphotransfer) domain-containing protein
MRHVFLSYPLLPADRYVRVEIVKQVADTNAEEEIFDKSVALARVGGDEDLLKEIAILFLDDYPKSLTELRAAVDTGDARRLERSAHGLKGSVSNFGARPAVDAALQLETMGRAQEMVEVEQVLHTLELALAALRPELESL